MLGAANAAPNSPATAETGCKLFFALPTGWNRESSPAGVYIATRPRKIFALRARALTPVLRPVDGSFVTCRIGRPMLVSHFHCAG